VELTIDLNDVDTEALVITGTSSDVTLESLMGGPAMAEMAASCAPCSCSCCVVCCCCCCT
jgi:hypothetical protein